MNWVGGSRSRLVLKNDSKKQREFFEKRRMQQKVRNVAAACPRVNSGNMDLVTLFVVNQIAAKKEIRGPPKVQVVGRSKHKSHDSLVLPMSPCSPSQLCLAESQPQYSAPGKGQRRNVVPQGLKFCQLSPVLESAFSDNSASDYLAPRADPFSSFSSTPSTSSGQGIFPLQSRSLNKARPCPSPSWDASGLDQTEFPFFVTHNKTWSGASNQPLYQQETPTTAQILFGNPESSETDARDCFSRGGRLTYNQPLWPMLEMVGKEQQFKDDVFRGFCSEEYEREGRSNSKIHLRHETPNKCATPQTVPDSESGGELSSSIHTNLSAGSGHKAGPEGSCEHLPGYSHGESYLSSDSNDEEECCQLCLNAPASYVNQARCDGPRVNGGSQASQPSPFTPPVKAKGNLGEEEQKVTGHEACRSGVARRSSPRPPTQETREAATQTVATAERRDASAQCDGVVHDVELDLSFPPADACVQLPARGRQPTPAPSGNYKRTYPFCSVFSSNYY